MGGSHSSLAVGSPHLLTLYVGSFQVQRTHHQGSLSMKENDCGVGGIGPEAQTPLGFPTSHMEVPGFQSQLRSLQQAPPNMPPGRQWGMDEVFGLLPRTWETRWLHCHHMWMLWTFRA